MAAQAAMFHNAVHHTKKYKRAGPWVIKQQDLLQSNLVQALML